MAYAIDKKICIVCGTCELECPKKAIYLGDDIKFCVDETKCVSCGACARICPVDAITKQS